jgi:medium-chain acyl-[acyl-carrier-protein] hydrolase
MSDRWLRRLTPYGAACAHLFCFPYAGGGAATFRTWPARLPERLAVWVVQLPGRASRLDEPAVSDIPALADAVAGALVPHLHLPFTFFGHSMGAVLACEAARALTSRGCPAPRHLVVSGRRPPEMPGKETPIHLLSDDRFIAEVSNRYGAVPAELMREPEVLTLLLPGLRADFTALETFRPGPRAPLGCPISAFGGTHDRLTPRAHLEAWRGQTTGPAWVRSFPGDHFYLNDQRAALLADLSTIVTPMLCDADMSEATT